MKKNIPINQLQGKLSGLRLDRFNDAYLDSISDSVTKAHRNDHFICLLLESGNGEILVDFKGVHLSPDKLLFLQPEQVKRVVSFSNSDGWALFFGRNFLDSSLKTISEEFRFQESVINVSQDEKKWFLNAFSLLEYSMESDEILSYKQLVVSSLIKTFVYKLAGIYNSILEYKVEKYSSRKMEISASFRRLLEQHYREVKSPNAYAEMMNLSLGYLNDTIKNVTGLSVSKNIQMAMVSEAQRLLYYSSLSIKEIAEKVGFESAHYFNRVFTRSVRQTPGDFRKKSRK